MFPLYYKTVLRFTNDVYLFKMFSCYYLLFPSCFQLLFCCYMKFCLNLIRKKMLMLMTRQKFLRHIYDFLKTKYTPPYKASVLLCKYFKRIQMRLPNFCYDNNKAYAVSFCLHIKMKPNISTFFSRCIDWDCPISDRKLARCFIKNVACVILKRATYCLESIFCTKCPLTSSFSRFPPYCRSKNR